MSVDPVPPVPPNPPALPGARRRKILRWVLVGLGGAALALVASMVVWNEWTRHRLHAAQERFRTAGLPSKIDDIRPPPVPEADNAFPLVQRIAELVKSSGFRKTDGADGISWRLLDFKTRHREYRLEADAVRELAAILDEPAVRELVALSQAAAMKPGYYANYRYELGASMQMPEMTPVSEAVRVLEMQARLAINRGDVEGACTCLWAMLGAAEFFRAEPILLAQLTRAAMLSLTVEALEKAAATMSLPPAWLARFRTRIAAIDLAGGIPRMLDGERVSLGEVVFQQMMAKPEMLASLADEADEAAAARLFRYMPSGLIRIEHAVYLEQFWLLRGALADPALPYMERVKRARELGEALPARHALVAIVLPTLASVAEKVFRAHVKLGVVNVGLALEQERARVGRYPANLAAFAAGVFEPAEGPDDLVWHGGFIPPPRALKEPESPEDK
jgi:hypothetical protein